MIYFDNSATTKPYDEVLHSFMKVASEYFGNPSSLHALGGQAEKLLNQARGQIAELLDVQSSEIYFTSGGTESNNLAIKGGALFYKKRGRHLITTSIEHPSVKAAMAQLEQEGFEVTYLPVSSDGKVSVEDVEKAIRKDTVLISIIHVNNEVGTIQPIEEIGKLLGNYPKILFHVDHVQGIGKVPLQLKSSRVDLCSFSAHKFHGLKGTGLLYMKNGIHLAPLFSGGNQENKLRSGTENVAGAVSMAKALRMVLERQNQYGERIQEIKSIVRDEIGRLHNAVINTPEHHSAPHILNFSFPGVKPEVIVHALGQQNIFVSTTSACSSKTKKPSPTLLAMGKSPKIAESSIRISFSYDNHKSEAVKFLTCLKQAVNKVSEVIN
ncbi:MULTISPECIES: cysteine desulfurase family protein [unclassified Bacillus (in: firmicutes)]|uniref:cysteine desulfurase family protein n=1 Tax=unclassified Bacillus (in: firmicutes) TaxID=185979 RepID=UPI0008E796B8|nr:MULTISPECIES: cysteine desulfurase family protein [unclassified Bacillus (in: firmicutes)]SFB17643.1 cysteine desulfurase [Bacillus sp. UNCCL13]SFQ76794.1 cysteine desulfurase [Bacillus sp. cl95]